MVPVAASTVLSRKRTSPSKRGIFSPGRPTLTFMPFPDLPIASAARSCGRCFSGSEKATSKGRTRLTTASAVSLILTEEPGNTSRAPTMPATGARMVA